MSTNAPQGAQELDTLSINTIRTLAADAVQKASSGHPGMPMGTAPMAYTLWTRFLRFNPRNPAWANRDRFVLSAGHGSMLLYSLLHLTGHDLSLDDIKNFRQWDSATPGHPEHGHTAGVETTTGPLGQGFGNAVGMALAEARLAAEFNRPGHEIIDHRTYVIASDGDIMEGVQSETASIAGHFGLHKLTVLYDDNRITIDGSTDLTFSEDVGKRYEAYGWDVHEVDAGNEVDAIEAAIRAANDNTGQPSLICIRTNIGYGSPNRQDSSKAHGEPLGEEEIRLTKENLGWPSDAMFLVPDEVAAHFGEAVQRGAAWEAEWTTRLEAYGSEDGADAGELERRLKAELAADWDADLPVFTADDGPIATRAASGKVLNAAAAKLPELMGGSADLAGSNNTDIEGEGDFERGAYGNRNLRFGVREHGDGGDSQRHGLARRVHPLRRYFLDLLGLHAPVDSSRGADAAGRGLRVHARQHRARRGRSDTSAHRAARRAAGGAGARRIAAGGRQRDARSVAGGHRAAVGAHGAHLDAAEAACSRW